MNGFDAETQVKTVGEILHWLQKAIHKHYPTSKGFVAKFWEEAIQARYTSVKRESGLVGDAEQLADEVSLADRISFGPPSHSALPDHVHCLDALQPRTLKRSIALGQPNSFLNRPVVLFNHVIEILALA